MARSNNTSFPFPPVQSNQRSTSALASLENTGWQRMTGRRRGVGAVINWQSQSESQSFYLLCLANEWKWALMITMWGYIGRKYVNKCATGAQTYQQMHAHPQSMYCVFSSKSLRELIFKVGIRATSKSDICKFILYYFCSSFLWHKKKINGNPSDNFSNYSQILFNTLYINTQYCIQCYLAE